MIQYTDLIQISSVLPALICMYVLLCLFLCNFATCEDLCIITTVKIQYSFINTKISQFPFHNNAYLPYTCATSFSKPWKPLLYSLFIKFQNYYINYVNGIIKYVTSWDCFFTQYNSVEIHPSCFTDKEFILFLLLSLVWIYHTLCKHSPIERHLGCFSLGLNK